jgi:hypothetical protein
VQFIPYPVLRSSHALLRNFDDHVKSAYKWLMDYYQYAQRRLYHPDAHCIGYRPHDKIFIFGFSRGAYAARALAGMIQKVRRVSVYAYEHSRHLRSDYYPPETTVRSHCKRRPRFDTLRSLYISAYDVYKAPWCEEKGGDVISPNHLARRYRGIFGISRGVVVHFIGVWQV